MKKTIIIILLILITVGLLFVKTKKQPPLDKNIASYKNSNLGIYFDYPKILSVNTKQGKITLSHSVPFSHHDYCDFKGEIDTTIDTLTDFNVNFQIQEKNLVESMKTLSPYIPNENFINNAVIESPGFIDSYSIGDLKGYKIFEGAEGCGQTTYYFPISDNKTLVVQEELVTVFTGSIDVENKKKAEAVPGVINKEKSTEIFKSILNSLKI